MQIQKTFLCRVGQFLIYTILIYACYIWSAIYHEKILKYQYLNDITGDHQNFDAAIVFTLFPQFFACVLGYCLLSLNQKINHVTSTQIPWRKAALCSFVININMFTYNQAVIYASFPAVVMVKSCSVLSVILVGIFCSRVKDKELKLGKQKLFIGILVTMGILIFNIFKITQKDNNDKAISWFSAILLFVSLIGDGILPDLQAQIKADYRPSAIDMYYHINKYTCLIALLYSCITGKILYIWQFAANHKQIQLDLFLFSILNSFGQLIIYQMIKLFRQHIPAFVIATRKCFTVVINIIYFHHSVVLIQVLGMLLVFSAVMLEVYGNYQQQQSKTQNSIQNKPMQLQCLKTNQQFQSGQKIPQEEQS